MISIDEARALVLQEADSRPPHWVELDKATGLVLAVAVHSDIDSPPFDKSMMDGVALRYEELERGRREFRVAQRILAGSVCPVAIESGDCAAVMTGSAIPAGTDTVVMREHVSGRFDQAGSVIRIDVAPPRRGLHVLYKGATLTTGQRVLDAGHLTRPHDIGPLAEAGAARVAAVPRPSLAIIATGDELVPVHEKPGLNKIRNSNGPLLAAMARRWCANVMDLGIVADQRDALSRVVNQGLQADVLVISGGVSEGVADLVPGVLKDAGVRKIFHKVAIKPGKPLWFGAWDSPSGQKTLVFGLPGNPVSSMCCFHVFVQPALLAMAGRPAGGTRNYGQLDSSHGQQPGRTVFWPSRVDDGKAIPTLHPLDWKGSADLLTLGQANAFAIFPGDRDRFEIGETVEFAWLDRGED